MQTTHQTKLIGVLTHPVGENLIHSMLSAACTLAEVDAAPLQFDATVRELSTPVASLRSLGAVGAYLDGRLRTAAAGLVDYLSDEAHGSGVINVMTFEDDHARGHNTEAQGMIDLLEPHRDAFMNGSAVVLGAGAMARAAVYALVRHFRVKFLAIADRTPQQAQILKQQFSGTKTSTRIEAHELFPPDIAQLLAEARLIINATSVGSWPEVEATPITIPDIFHSRQVVLDTTYSPAVTRMLREADEAEATTLTGVELLLAQIGRAFTLLTDTPFPVDGIRELLESNYSASGSE